MSNLVTSIGASLRSLRSHSLPALIFICTDVPPTVMGWHTDEPLVPDVGDLEMPPAPDLTAHPTVLLLVTAFFLGPASHCHCPADGVDVNQLPIASCGGFTETSAWVLWNPWWGSTQGAAHAVESTCSLHGARKGCKPQYPPGHTSNDLPIPRWTQVTTRLTSSSIICHLKVTFFLF